MSPNPETVNERRLRRIAELLAKALTGTLADYENCPTTGDMGVTWKANIKASRTALRLAAKYGVAS